MCMVDAWLSNSQFLLFAFTGLKPPVMDSLIEEAEQRGFRLDILNSSSDEEKDAQKERDIIINNVDRNINRNLY